MATCTNCGKTYAVGRNSYGLYCSNSCQQRHRQSAMFAKWTSGEEVSKSSRTLGGLLRAFEGNTCSVCGITEWNGKELKMQCDHIDGNSDNNYYKNIRLVCPNCDAQSSTYKNRNKGNGRHYRRVRYARSESY